MHVTDVCEADTPVVTLSGPITFGSRKTLRAIIDAELAQGHRDFILDMRQVTFVDSSGLGALVACLSSVRKQGGTMHLRHVPKLVYELMEMTKLSQFFGVSEATLAV
jgi:anti-sigma B factor antagonist